MITSLSLPKFQGTLSSKSLNSTNKPSFPSVSQPDSAHNLATPSSSLLRAYSNVKFKGSDGAQQPDDTSLVPISETGLANTNAVSFNSVLDHVKQNIDRATDFQWQAQVKGGAKLLFQLGNNNYTLESYRTGGTYKDKAGTEYYENNFKITRQPLEGGEPEISILETPTYDEQGIIEDPLDQIKPIANPKIENEFGLGAGLDGALLLADVAEGTLNQDLKWEEVQSDISFKDFFPSATGAVSTTLQKPMGKLPQGTQIAFYEEASFFGASKMMIGIQKPDGHRLVMNVASDNENEAAQLFGQANLILRQEKEIEEAKQQLAEAKLALQQGIDQFKAEH